MRSRSRIFLLLVIMSAIAIGVCLITLFTLYDASIEQLRGRLIETARGQARLMEAIARFDAQYSKDDLPGGSFAATLSQIRDAHERFRGFGETGEFTLARREGDQIVFLLSHRHDDLDNPRPVPFASQIAEPMRRALSGKSGSVVGLDYRGELVLAAYEPVAELNLGIVAKIDMSEIREPFVRAGLLAAGGGLALIFLGAILFLRIGNPMVRRIEESERKYRGIFQSAGDALFLMSLDGKLLDANPAACSMYGYTREEFLDLDPTKIIHPDYYHLFDEGREKVAAGESFSAESVAVRKDGASFHVEVRLSPVTHEGKTAALSIVRDISERVEVRQALEENERYFRTLIYDIHEDILVIDRDHTITDLNNTAMLTTGLEREDIIGKKCFEVFHGYDRPCGEFGETCELANVFRTGESRKHHHVHRHRGGSEVDVDILLSPLRDAEGNVTHVVEAARDVTDLLEAQRERDRILDMSYDLICVAGMDGYFKYLNPAWERTLGYTAEELLSRPFLDFIHPDDHSKNDAEVEKLAGGETTIDFENRYIHKNGSVRFISWSATPLLAEKTMYCVGRDITERKQAEEELHRYEYIVSSSSDLLALLDTDFIYLAANEAYLKAFGKTRDELIGHTVPEVFGEEFFETVIKPNAERCLAGEEVHYQDWVEFPIQGKRYMDVAYFPYRGADNEIRGYVVGARDITERKRAEDERKSLEAQMQHAQKLESLGVLAGGIAHDFNNLLTSILGNASLALMELSPASPVRDSINEIEIASKRAAELCRQMLAYSGKGRFVIEPIGLDKIVDEMAHLLEISISKKAVLRYNFADNLPAIEADATQIRQIIMNLITNASEAIGEKSGVISVSTGVMECDRAYLTETYLADELPEGAYAYIEVSDSGCGMDKETQDKLFDPFFTTKFTGRGLGLAAVLGIVRGHSGAIKVYSEPGKGTTFKVLFPATDEPVKLLDERGLPSDAWRGSGTVLLVDDEESVRTIGKRMLETLGFTVIMAADGREAIEVFREREEEITLVLLDLTMPHLGGDEAFRELRRIKSDVRVVLSSGYNEQEIIDRFAGKGLAGFIQKPYEYETMMKKIRAALEG